MIVVTGAAGFIGSACVAMLNRRGRTDIITVDVPGDDARQKNLSGLLFQESIERDSFLELVKKRKIQKPEAIIHMGADSSTTQMDMAWLEKNNFEYTKILAEYCDQEGIRFIYASSAATYGNGEQGYSDDETKLETLKPLNPYGLSKQMFDMWAKKNGLLNGITGLKYFNVFGPNESHKKDMRSMVHKAFGQIQETGKIKLFKSHRPDYMDGAQVRDFIYIKDAVEMTLFFLDNAKFGIYNVGTGKARSWNDLAKAVFKALNKPITIEYVDMPENIINQYQYHTQADISKIKHAGYLKPLYSLEDAIDDYVKNHLLPGKSL